MSDSISLLTQLTTAQAGKEATVNELLNSMSACSFGGRKQSSSGLAWDYFGGRILVDGVSTAIANGSVTLSASTTNYVESTRAGVVSKNTTAFTPGSIALYKVVTGTATVTSYEDHRPWVKLATGKLARSFASDANITLTHAECLNDIYIMTSGVSLTATRDVIIPLTPRWLTVHNNTTGGQSIRFIGASGTGATVGNGDMSLLLCDGTNISVISSSGGLLSTTDDLAEGVTNLYFTAARAIASALTGFSAGAGTVSATDTILQAINKIVGNIAALSSVYAPISQPYDTGAYYPGVPTASVICLLHVVNRTVTFPSSLTNSHGVSLVAATAQTDFDIQKNGSSIGTMRFAAAATTASFISASGATFSAGDVLKVIAPASPDATLSDISFLLAGTR